MKITAIDPGIRNLGVVMGTVCVQGKFYLENAKLIDLTKIKGSSLSEKLDLVLDRYPKINDNLVVIERQPPTGAALAVQELFISKCKDTKLIHPSTVAADRDTLKLSYADRKIKNMNDTESQLMPFSISNCPDVSDAVILAEYFSKHFHPPNIESFAYKMNPFKQFKYQYKKNNST